MKREFLIGVLIGVLMLTCGTAKAVPLDYFVHRDRDIAFKLKAEYQERFERENPGLRFHTVFGKRYKG